MGVRAISRVSYPAFFAVGTQCLLPRRPSLEKRDRGTRPNPAGADPEATRRRPENVRSRHRLLTTHARRKATNGDPAPLILGAAGIKEEQKTLFPDRHREKKGRQDLLEKLPPASPKKIPAGAYPRVAEHITALLLPGTTNKVTTSRSRRCTDSSTAWKNMLLSTDEATAALGGSAVSNMNEFSSKLHNCKVTDTPSRRQDFPSDVESPAEKTNHERRPARSEKRSRELELTKAGSKPESVHSPKKGSCCLVSSPPVTLSSRELPTVDTMPSYKSLGLAEHTCQ